MNKKSTFIVSIIAVILAVAALGFSVFTFFIRNGVEEAGYCVYIGLDGAAQTREEARDIITNICVNRLDGYTLAETYGGSKNNVESVTFEPSFVLTLYYTDEAAVHEVADEIMEKLNRKTVLITRQYQKVETYTGSQAK